MIDRDHHESITTAFPSELDALRYLNGRGYGRVQWIEWGKTIHESEAE